MEEMPMFQSKLETLRCVLKRRRITCLPQEEKLRVLESKLVREEQTIATCSLKEMLLRSTQAVCRTRMMT